MPLARQEQPMQKPSTTEVSGPVEPITPEDLADFDGATVHVNAADSAATEMVATELIQNPEAAEISVAPAPLEAATVLKTDPTTETATVLTTPAADPEFEQGFVSTESRPITEHPDKVHVETKINKLKQALDAKLAEVAAEKTSIADLLRKLREKIGKFESRESQIHKTKADLDFLHGALKPDGSNATDVLKEVEARVRLFNIEYDTRSIDKVKGIEL